MEALEPKKLAAIASCHNPRMLFSRNFSMETIHSMRETIRHGLHPCRILTQVFGTCFSLFCKGKNRPEADHQNHRKPSSASLVRHMYHIRSHSFPACLHPAAPLHGHPEQPHQQKRPFVQTLQLRLS
jgi:hypothetical protein